MSIGNRTTFLRRSLFQIGMFLLRLHGVQIGEGDYPLNTHAGTRKRPGMQRRQTSGTIKQ